MGLKDVVLHLTDVHEASSSSANCLLADNPHNQLTVLNMHLGNKTHKHPAFGMEKLFTLVSQGEIHL